MGEAIGQDLAGDATVRCRDFRKQFDQFAIAALNTLSIVSNHMRHHHADGLAMRNIQKGCQRVGKRVGRPEHRGFDGHPRKCCPKLHLGSSMQVGRFFNHTRKTPRQKRPSLTSITIADGIAFVGHEGLHGMRQRIDPCERSDARGLRTS